MIPPLRLPSSSAPGARGFALLVTIVLVAFLVLILVGLAAFTRVETQVATNSQQLALARQNALLGLQIAVGQLQRHAGPDQRVTVPATTVYPSKDVTRGTGPLYDDATFGFREKAVTSSTRSYLTRVQTYLTPTERTAWDAALATYWNNGASATNLVAPRRNPHWVGVFDSSLRVDRATNPNGTPSPLPRQNYEANPATTFGEPKRDQLPIWLVSGNEVFDFDPATATAYPTGYLTPDTPLADPTAAGSDTVYLVGLKSATLADTSTDGLDGRVKVKKMPLRATPPGAATEQDTGHYAYWVADESLKANFAVRDPFHAATEGSADYRNRLQVPQRLGWERITGFTASTIDVNSPDFLKIITAAQMPFLDASLADTASARGPVPRNYHSVTGYSRSLLTDTALGGLRKDLTRYLKTGAGLTDSDPIADASRYASNDPRFRAWNGTNTGFPANPNAGGIPSWGQLRDWYTNASNSGGGVTPSQDFAPVITYINMHTGFSYDPATRQIRMHWIPAVVLWNPYDVPLSNGSYDIDIGHSPHFFEFLVASPNVAPANVTLTDADLNNIPDTPVTEGNFRGNRTNPPAPSDFFYATAPFPNGWNNKSGNASDITFFNTDSDNSIGKGATSESTGRLQRTWNVMRDRDTPALRANDAVTQPTPTSTYIAVDHTMKFRITDNFNPGQSKIYTLGVADNDDTPNWSPNNRLSLQNLYNADAPASAWFPVMTILANAPTESLTNPNGLSRTIKFSSGMQDTTYAAPYLRFAIAGSSVPISESFSLGNVQFDHIAGAIRRTPATQPVSAWRRDIPHTDRFADFFTPLDTGNTGSMYPAFRVWMEPLTSPGGKNSAHIVDYVPGFSRYNLSRNTDPHPLVDGLRSQFQVNNSDALSNGINFRGKPGAGAGAGPVWDEDQSADGEEAYSLITFQNKPGARYAPLSSLPIRNARRLESEILSLGQFQQANLSPYFWQPTFPIGNSDASPYVDREAIAGIHSRVVGGQTSGGGAIGRVPNTGITTNRTGKPVPANTMVDLSYLLNENLWDSFFLSTIDGTPNLAEPLPNSRLHFTREASTATPAELAGFDTTSAYLQNVGALNVNSTSFEAWKALLTAFRDLKLGDNPDDTVPVARTLNPIGDSIAFTEATQNASHIGSVATNKDYSRVMNGFRYLTDAMIDTLARRIVDENRLRGPYFSLADFVNRRLVAPAGSNTPGTPWYVARTDGNVGSPADNHNDFIVPSYDPFVGLHGLNGTLQRAINVSGINGGINHPDHNPNGDDRVYSVIMVTGGASNGDDASATTTGTEKHNFEPTLRSHLDSEHFAGSPAGEVGQSFQGAPGFVTQGDLLAMLGPALTARGDTFLVRTYGDSINPATGDIQARAWLEAVVQRTIEPVTSAGSTGADKYRPADAFGRRFEVVSFRWLSESDL